MCCYFDGQLYEGTWANDKKSGKAIEILANGGKYVGNFANGKRNGKGQFKWVSHKISLLEFIFIYCKKIIQTNGEVYDGEWKNGLKHGSGLWKSPKGDLRRVLITNLFLILFLLYE